MWVDKLYFSQKVNNDTLLKNRDSETDRFGSIETKRHNTLTWPLTWRQLTIMTLTLGYAQVGIYT